MSHALEHEVPGSLKSMCAFAVCNTVRKAAVYPLYNPSTSHSPCPAQAAELYSSATLYSIQPLQHPSGSARARAHLKSNLH
eukprot:4936528-Prymnesium_polylepis.1